MGAKQHASDLHQSMHGALMNLRHWQPFGHQTSKGQLWVTHYPAERMRCAHFFLFWSQLRTKFLAQSFTRLHIWNSPVNVPALWNWKTAILLQRSIISSAQLKDWELSPDSGDCNTLHRGIQAHYLLLISLLYENCPTRYYCWSNMIWWNIWKYRMITIPTNSPKPHRWLQE